MPRVDVQHRDEKERLVPNKHVLAEVHCTKASNPSSSVVIGDRLSCTQTLGSGDSLRPLLRLGDLLRQLYVELLVGDAVEQMPDQVQPGAALVVGRDDVPGRLWRVGD